MKKLIVLCSAAFLIACGGTNNTIKGVSNLTTRPDCKGPCGKVMPCEGKTMTLEVELRNNNILQGGAALFVRDPDNFDYTVKIEFGESVPPEIYANAKDAQNKRLRVTGIIEGYDVYVHELCTRSYTFKVNDAKNFSLLKD